MKYKNYRLAIDSVSVNIYIETGGEPIHIVYWNEDEWIEDSSIVPSIMNAIYLYFTDPVEVIKRTSFGREDFTQYLITQEDINKFKVDWGQTHSEICCNLEYDEEGAESMLTDDYFWYDELWLNKGASGFEGKDELIANFLRYEAS